MSSFCNHTAKQFNSKHKIGRKKIIIFLIFSNYAIVISFYVFSLAPNSHCESEYCWVHCKSKLRPHAAES